jgi:hypothetical protein
MTFPIQTDIRSAPPNRTRQAIQRSKSDIPRPKPEARCHPSAMRQPPRPCHFPSLGNRLAFSGWRILPGGWRFASDPRMSSGRFVGIEQHLGESARRRPVPIPVRDASSFAAEPALA